jgi:hypothetical protein
VLYQLDLWLLRGSLSSTRTVKERPTLLPFHFIAEPPLAQEGPAFAIPPDGAQAAIAYAMSDHQGPPGSPHWQEGVPAPPTCQAAFPANCRRRWAREAQNRLGRGSNEGVRRQFRHRRSTSWPDARNLRQPGAVGSNRLRCHWHVAGCFGDGDGCPACGDPPA